MAALQHEVHNAVSKVTALLEQPEVLALHSTAAQLIDVLLQLASSLQRAELVAPSAAALLLQQLQQAAAPATPGPSTPQLMALVQRMGYRSADFQAAQAQVSIRTAHALQQGSAASMAASSILFGTQVPSLVIPSLAGLDSKAEGTAAASPESLQQQQALQLDKVLDLLLQLAGALPHFLPMSGRQGSLHEMMAERLLPLTRQLPLSEQQLSSRGWESYFLLEPQAATNAKAASQATLPGAAGPPLRQKFAEVLRHRAHLQAAVSACAAHPALHLVARQALHAWLAESGNPAVWQLLVLLRHRAASVAAPAAAGQKGGICNVSMADGVPVGGAAAAKERAEATEAATGAQEGGELRPGNTVTLGTGEGDLVLPLALRVLYPAGPARDLSTLLHTTPPSPEGLRQAAALLQATHYPCTAIQPQPGATTTAATARLDVTSDYASQGQGHNISQQLWEALLDYPHWLGFALQQLPLLQPEALLGEDAAIPAASASANMREAAAVYLSWLMWPQDWRRRLVLYQGLAEQHAEVDQAVIEPWLQTLSEWQRMWHGME
ncbi:hypothetical protein N2152v2_002814 [Parachlorella kessleri]